VSVLVIAAFLCALIAGLAPMLTYDGDSRASTGKLSTSMDYYFPDNGGLEAAQAHALASKLEAVPGVRVIEGYIAEETPQIADSLMILSCADLAYIEEKASCPAEATAMRLSVGFGQLGDASLAYEGRDPLTLSPDDIQKRNVVKFIVTLEGDITHVEQFRTVASQYSSVLNGGFRLQEELRAQDQERMASIRSLINAAFLIVLFVAGCSLAVAVSGGIVERKRPFGLLRVTGTSLKQLRNVVLIESIVPLLSAVILASMLGFAVAILMIKSFATEELSVIQPPVADYYITMVLGIGAALLILLATLPLLAAVTKPNNARFE
jgi:hypothetical protein